MKALYDLVEQHNVNTMEKDGLRARAVSRGTVDKEWLYEWLAVTSGFRRGQIEGIMSSLTEAILDHLKKGYDVQLDDLGFLSLAVKSRPVKKRKDLRAESVYFKNVNFRLSVHARRQLETMDFERVEKALPTSATHRSLEQRAAMLKLYLSTHPCITRTEYSRIACLLKGQALIDLKQFVEENWLVKYGAGRTVVYLLNRMGK